jgi:hypothetical protein
MIDDPVLIIDCEKGTVVAFPYRGTEGDVNIRTCVELGGGKVLET